MATVEHLLDTIPADTWQQRRYEVQSVQYGIIFSPNPPQYGRGRSSDPMTSAKRNLNLLPSSLDLFAITPPDQLATIYQKQ